jgi:hypothetical protein
MFSFVSNKTFILYFGEFVSFVKSFTASYLVWITLHYACSHLYVQYCVPSGIMGFLYSPFMTPMPHCVAMRWVVYNGGKIVEVMWFMLGKWALEKLVFPSRVQPLETPNVSYYAAAAAIARSNSKKISSANKDNVPEEVHEKMY